MPRGEADVSQHELSREKKGKQTYTKLLEIMLIQLKKKYEFFVRPAFIQFNIL